MLKKRLLIFTLSCCGLVLSLNGSAKFKSSRTDGREDAWRTVCFENTDSLPFSFVYDGRPSAQFLKTCSVKTRDVKSNDGRIKVATVYTDPVSGLEVRCERVGYTDYPAVEWTLYFKNTGKQKTGIIENILGLDAAFDLDGSDEVYLNRNTGGMSGIGEYQPVREKLEKEASRELGAFWGGFPTAENLPFFNAEWTKDGRTRGMITAIGWPARWKASFDRMRDTALTVKVGQITTRMYLNPGEEIRTPLVVLLFWEGTRTDAQNMWRRWMYDYNLPRPGGKLPEPILEAASSSFFAEMFHATDKDQMEFIDRYLEEGIKLDYWWMDAGWYPNKGGSWQDLLGSWWPDPKRYPDGLRAISDHAHRKGVKTLLWFEPERVTEGSWIFENHPEWTLGVEAWKSPRFFNYGNPEARKWMVGHVDSLLVSEDIDLYRQDFAVFASEYWDEQNEKDPDRQGIAENKHVMGYLEYMDELQRRHPGMLFDICAAGGKRLELENLRRAVPLWRSDYAFEPRGVQAQTYGLSEWIPFSGAGVNKITAYDFRSNMNPSIVLNLDARVRDADYPLLRRLLAQWKEVRDDYRGDYYPLTGYSLQDDVWMGWEFFRPETGTGFVQMFNRPGSIYDSGVCRLKGLDPAVRYRITDLDSRKSEEYAGAELLDKGLRITFGGPGEDKLLRIESVR